MVVAVAWRNVAAMVPSVGTMGSWSPPLVPYGGRGGDDDVVETDMEEPNMIGLRRGLVRSNGVWTQESHWYVALPCLPFLLFSVSLQQTLCFADL
jgi:hypothetical protein